MSRGPKSGEETPKEGCPEGPRTPAGPAKLVVLELCQGDPLIGEWRPGWAVCATMP